jgi:hypothetical protein
VADRRVNTTILPALASVALVALTVTRLGTMNNRVTELRAVNIASLLTPGELRVVVIKTRNHLADLVISSRPEAISRASCPPDGGRSVPCARAGSPPRHASTNAGHWTGW